MSSRASRYAGLRAPLRASATAKDLRVETQLEPVTDLITVDTERVRQILWLLLANAIKFTIRRLKPSGSPGERDVFGSQQYAPLFDVKVP